MSTREATQLLDGPLVAIWLVACRAPRSPVGEPESATTHQIVIPRRGVFQIHAHREAAVADPHTAILLRAGAEYCVSHPTSAGDDCFVLAVSPGLVDEALGDAPWRYGTVRPIAQLRASVLEGSLRHRTVDRLEAEEAALEVVGTLASDINAERRSRTGRRATDAHRNAAAVREVLGSDPTSHWRLSTIARAVGCSPFHLARQFKHVTGMTIHHYLLGLRLALALQRITQGESNLARLAVEIGFAHHSHMTARFGATFGVTPRLVRHLAASGEQRPPPMP